MISGACFGMRTCFNIVLVDNWASYLLSHRYDSRFETLDSTKTNSKQCNFIISLSYIHRYFCSLKSNFISFCSLQNKKQKKSFNSFRFQFASICCVLPLETDFSSSATYILYLPCCDFLWQLLISHSCGFFFRYFYFE